MNTHTAILMHESMLDNFNKPPNNNVQFDVFYLAGYSSGLLIPIENQVLKKIDFAGLDDLLTKNEMDSKNENLLNGFIKAIKKRASK